MKKVFKPISIGIVLLFLFLITIFSFNVLKKDFKYAHQSYATYQDPFDWFSYNLKTKIIKIFLDLKKKDEEGLPVTSFHINKSFIKELLEKTPDSTKKWKDAFLINQDETFNKIKVRLKGDNPTNWLFEKKHWRVKTEKNELINRQREFEYIPFDLQTYLSGKIANSLGLLSPKFKPIELFINDESQGTYIETETLNESFLRRKKIMPVNIYKGEQILAETIIELENNLFNSPGALKKIAYFNQVNVNDKSDLIYLFNLFQLSNNNNTKYSDLLNSINLNYWSKFSAYQIITQNFHNDSSHNFRLLSDPWSGYFTPIVYDPLFNLDNNNLKIDFDKSSNEMFLLLNQDSSFQNLKLEFINNILNSELIENEIKDLESIEGATNITKKRDVEALFKDFSIVKLFLGLFTDKYNFDNSEKKRKIFIQKFLLHKENLKNILYSKPKANWYETQNGFEIYINNEVPISNLNINFLGKKPNWIAIDLNENKKFDSNEVKFYPNNEQEFIIPLRFYANRIPFSNQTIDLLKPKLKTVTTRFKFITDNSFIPDTIKYQNPFSKKNYFLKKKKITSFPFIKNNQPVDLNSSQFKDIVKNERFFNKTIFIKQTLIVKEDAFISPGTSFKIANGSHIIFKKKVTALGTSEKPISFEKADTEPWGAVVLQGPQTKGSVLENVIFDGGSGGMFNNIKYTGALSIHNTENIILKKIKMVNNNKFDDMFHVVYTKNLKIDSIDIEKSHMDAIDIDMSSNIEIKNAKIKNSGNDAVDLMESDVVITNSRFDDSKDKGISVGENSFLILNNSILSKNNTGVATKDKSFSFILNSDLKSNDVPLNNFKKNWRYGDGGITKVYKSKFKNNNRIKVDKKSTIQIIKSTINDDFVEESIISKKNNTNHLSILKNNNYKSIKKILKKMGINLQNKGDYLGANL